MTLRQLRYAIQGISPPLKTHFLTFFWTDSFILIPAFFPSYVVGNCIGYETENWSDDEEKEASSDASKVKR